MKRNSMREHPLCAICLFVRTYGLSKRPHELSHVSLVGAFSFALVIAGMTFGVTCIILAGLQYSRRFMDPPDTRPHQAAKPIQNGAPLRGAPSFF